MSRVPTLGIMATRERRTGKTGKTGRTGRRATERDTSSAKASAPAAPASAKKVSRAKKNGAPPRARDGRPALVIVESPTKAKTIGKYLGSGYDVKATVGHLRDLPTRELGVDVENNFEPKYVTIKGKTKTLSELKKAAKAASAIYLATDPDREGEAIAWHVAEQIRAGLPASIRTHRILFHEITKEAIQEALRDPGKIDDRKVDAQQARRILDRLVGYKASPILWHSIKTGLSAGRVQTVALRLIVEREREIRAFKPQEYWSIEALCAKNGQTFEAALHKVAGHKPQLQSEADARAIVDAVRPMPFVVSKVEKKNRKKNPAAPFTTSTLQQEAAKKLGFSSRRTMRAAQDLYEGKDVGEDGAVGLITYMRTDSFQVSDTAIQSVRGFIKKNYAKGYLPETPNAYNPKKNAR